ncbi:tryptophan synthase beta subunit-like PLP-dependent enzyme [Chytriomyces sp. MP71]|nr:tryptophan synthase beta subunit-like PLP-dependent enzyme [Chytriomyces sp. MP71]
MSKTFRKLSIEQRKNPRRPTQLQSTLRMWSAQVNPLARRIFAPTEVPVYLEWNALPYQPKDLPSLHSDARDLTNASPRAIVKKNYDTLLDERVKAGSLEGMWRFSLSETCLTSSFRVLLRPHSPTRASIFAVLGATSGDTGGAAIYGLRGKRNVDVFILHPKDRISPVQEQQMTSVLDPNVHNIAVDGATFDDCQEMVKLKRTPPRSQPSTSLFPPATLVISLPHTTPSAWASLFLDLLIATNDNDILHRFLETSVYSMPQNPTPNASDAVLMTYSPATDILVSSNFERVPWHFVFAEFGENANRASEAIPSGWWRSRRQDNSRCRSATCGRRGKCFGRSG